MSRLRLASRLARREIRRHPWRTALAVVIMALPVMAAQGSVLAIGAHQAADRLADDVQLEGADLATPPGAVGPFVDDGLVPEPVRVEQTFSFEDWLVGENGDLDPVKAIGMVEGSPRVLLERGRLPRNGNEVLANARTLDASHRSIGDQIELARGDVKLRVVGEAVVRDLANRPAIVIGPRAERNHWLSKIMATPGDGPVLTAPMSTELTWFAPGVDGAAAFEELTSEQFGGGDFGTVGGTSASTVAAIAALVGGAIGIIAVVASVAFTVGSRRRLRSLGLLASSGAAPTDAAWMVLLEGLWCGAVAAVVATAGTYAWWATIGRSVLVKPLIGHTVASPPLPMRPLATFGIALVCLVIGPLAAAVPARTAARTPVLTALGGRRPLPALKTRIPLAGLVAFALGTAAITRGITVANQGRPYGDAVYALAGLAVVFGGVAMAPAIVATLGRLGRRTRGAAKLALRGLSRDRTRNAAVVGAAAVTLALPVVAVTQLAHDTNRRNLTQPTFGQVTITAPPADLPGAIRNVEQILGDGTVAAHLVTVESTAPDPGPDGAGAVLAVMTPDDVETWFGGTEIATLLQNGEAVHPYLVGSHALQDRTCSLPQVDGLYRHGAPPKVATIEVTADDVTRDPTLASLVDLADSGGLIVQSDVLASGRTAASAISAVVLRARPLTAAEDAELRQIGVVQPTLAQIRGSAPPGTDAKPVSGGWSGAQGVHVGTNRQAEDHRGLMTLAGIGVATLFSLAIVLVALALAVADGRDDERLFAAIGGAPGLLRRKRTVEAAVLTFGAGLLGVGIGLIPTVAVLWASRPRSSYVFLPASAGYDDVPVPAVELALMVIAVTVVVTAVVWAVQAVGCLRPRRDLVLTDG